MAKGRVKKKWHYGVKKLKTILRELIINKTRRIHDMIKAIDLKEQEQE